jgi:ATP-binding cassette subfamily B protein/subfamily B ATP-binding cassette protein MsbA
LVAVLWGANLGSVYPFIEVVFNGKTIHDWADAQEDSVRKEIKDTETLIAKTRSELNNAKGDQLALLQRNLELANSQLDIKQLRIDSMLKYRPWIDKWAPRDPFTTLVYLVLFLFIGTIIRGLLLMGNMVLVARVGQRTILDIQNRVFDNVLNMEVSELEGVKGTGDLISRIRGETSAIGIAITTLFGKTVREPMKMSACLLGAAWVNWRLLLFSMIVCPIAGYIMVTLARLTKKANKKAIEESARLLDRLYQALMYIRVVKAFSMEDSERQRFKVVARDVYKKSMLISFYGAIARMNNELLGVSIVSLSVLAGGYLVLNNQEHLFGIRMCAAPMSVSALFMFYAFLIGISDPLRKMADSYNMIQGGVVAAERVFPLMDRIPAIREPASPVRLPAGKLGVQFENVSFSYDSDKKVLHNISFNVPAGTSLAIIGHNGCGKSTAINLLPRFFDVQAGSIRVGGTDIREIPIKELRSKIGYVTQLTMLFNESIAENIGYGSRHASRAEVIAAARKAHADSFIESLEHGYDSDIGEHGGKLSGGQRQRLSLARAILKNAEILLLDEATSQIDPESEVLIHRTLAEFIKNRTTIIVTHRLSTLELVDRILVMKEGRVMDCGTHEQLLARCVDYRRLRQMDLEGAA